MERALTVCCFAGTLISHDRLLLQINPERELGNMSYKLGQVSHAAALAVGRGMSPGERVGAYLPKPPSPLLCGLLLLCWYWGLNLGSQAC